MIKKVFSEGRVPVKIWTDEVEESAAQQLDDFKAALAIDTFGMTLEAAQAKGICIDCRQPALPRCYSDAGRREYKISGLCEKCFDTITTEPGRED